MPPATAGFAITLNVALALVAPPASAPMYFAVPLPSTTKSEVPPQLLSDAGPIWTTTSWASSAPGFLTVSVKVNWDPDWRRTGSVAYESTTSGVAAGTIAGPEDPPPVVVAAAAVAVASFATAFLVASWFLATVEPLPVAPGPVM